MLGLHGLPWSEQRVLVPALCIVGIITVSYFRIIRVIIVYQTVFKYNQNLLKVSLRARERIS